MVKLTTVGEDKYIYTWLNTFGLVGFQTHQHRTRVNKVDTTLFNKFDTDLFGVLVDGSTQYAIVGREYELVEYIQNGGGEEMFLLPDAEEFIMTYLGYVRDPETKYWVTKKFLGIK